MSGERDSLRVPSFWVSGFVPCESVCEDQEREKFPRIAEFEPMLRSVGQLYAPRGYGDQTLDGVWEGWVILFRSDVPAGNEHSTPRRVRDLLPGLVPRSFAR
jgi:hypothetical protein